MLNRQFIHKRSSVMTQGKQLVSRGYTGVHGQPYSLSAMRRSVKNRVHVQYNIHRSCSLPYLYCGQNGRMNVRMHTSTDVYITCVLLGASRFVFGSAHFALNL
jgi:hypothetical protein